MCPRRLKEQQIFVLGCHCVIVKSNQKLQDCVFKPLPSADLDGSEPSPVSLCAYKNINRTLVSFVRGIRMHGTTIKKLSEMYKDLSEERTTNAMLQSDSRQFTKCQLLEVLFV